MGRYALVTVIATLFLLVSGVPATAATFTVSNTDDDGPGSLRNAIAQANATGTADDIVFTTTGVISLTSGRLIVTSDMTITGPGVDSLEVSGADGDRVFHVDAAAAATISGLTIADGLVVASGAPDAVATGGNGSPGLGGGASGAPSSQSGGNGTDDGGAGVANFGNLTLRDVRVTNNLAQAGNGGNGVATGGAGGFGGGGGPCTSGCNGGAGGSATALGGTGGAAQGGGIRNTGTLRLERVRVDGNTVSAGSSGRSEAQGGGGASGGIPGDGGAGGAANATGGPGGAGRGGGLYNEGTLVVRESTIAGNNSIAGSGGRSESRGGKTGDPGFSRGGAGGTATANTPGAGGTASGAGIHNAGALTLEASTVTGNTASGGTGGDAAARGGDGGNASVFSIAGGPGGTATAARGGDGGLASGAGVANEATLRVVNGTLSGNVASAGTPGSTATSAPGNPGAAAGGAPGGAGGTAIVAGVGAAGAGSGGGLANGGSPTFTVRSSTVAGNRAPEGANLSNGGSASLINTILAEPRGGGENCSGPINSRGFNIDDGTSCGLGGPGDQSGVDPLLGVLANNGGPVLTRAPEAQGPAIDRGSSDGLTFDARGSGRPSNFSAIANPAGGDGADVGAVELIGDGLPDPVAPGGPAGPGPDGTAPSFMSARLTNRTFAVNRRAPAEATARAAAAKKGTTFAYTLSEPARVVFTIESKQNGRKVGRSCRKPSRSNRKRKRCVRWVPWAAFAHQGAAGINRKPFSGRIGRKVLKPWSYRASLVATDAAGNVSAAKRLPFKVVRR